MENKTHLPDYVVNTQSPVLTLSEQVTWSLTDYNVQMLHEKGYKGQGIKVAIIDTGVSTHPDLNVTYAEDMTSTSLKDEHGHGTHVAGIVGALENSEGVRGIAPEAEIYSFKVISSSSGRITDVIRGINRAVELGCHIINMSLGTAADVPALKAACRAAAEKGVLVICASGNSGRESIAYPGRYDSCIAVGSVNRNQHVSAFTSFGQPLDIMAPGEKILSTYINNGYAILSGTSMASPWIAGMCALLMSAGIDVNYEVITTNTIDIKDPGFDNFSGYGIFDPHKVLARAIPPEEPTNSAELIELIEIVEDALSSMRKLIIP